MIERKSIGALQAECGDFGPYYAYLRGSQSDEQRRASVVALVRRRPHMFQHGVKPSGVLANMHRFCMVDGLLYRRVHRPAGLELRCCAPRGMMRGMFAIIGRKPLPFRRELILHYHNSKMGNHVGREQTIKRLEADWYWPTLRTDVDRWIASCTICKGQHGIPATSAWSRTTLYSRPFRCLIYDTVLCPNDTDTGCNEMLTVI